MENTWDRYIRLMRERPSLFSQSDELRIITDEKSVREFCEKNGIAVGVVYESPYSLLVVDLVTDKSGRAFTYERLVPANPGAVVCMPVYDGKFVLLRQFRHAIRTEQYAFPRGFGEPGISSEDNLKKELAEEIGARVLDLTYLGKTVADSGMLGNFVDVYCCNVTEPEFKPGYEGIRQLCTVDADVFERMIASGEINDGFTLSAYALYSAHQNLKKGGE